MNSKNLRQAAVAKAKQEIEAETLEKAVRQYKAKLRELEAAKTVVANLQRELEDLELAIEQGNI